MEVILLDKIPTLGERGSTVKVKPGYARNYLFPRNLALPATDANRRVFSERERVMVKRDEQAKLSAQERAAGMSELSCSIAVQVSDEDKLYGSVTAADIAKALAAAGHEFDKKQIMLEEPIKQLGVYTVDIRLHAEVSAPIKVWVVKE